MRHLPHGSAETYVTILGMDCIVRYDFRVTHEGCPAVMYLRNGDPGYPAEATEYELTATELREDDGTQAGVVLALPAWLAALIEQTIYGSDHVRETVMDAMNDGPDPDQAREDARERRIME